MGLAIGLFFGFIGGGAAVFWVMRQHYRSLRHPMPLPPLRAVKARTLPFDPGAR